MEIWLHPALRFAHYALLLGLFGLVAFRAIGLPASMARAASGNARLAVGAAIMAPAVTLALMLVGIAEMMGQPVSELERETIAAMVLQTSVGWAFLARLLVLVTAALVLLYSARSPGWTPVVAVLYALALITLPWSGHAAAGGGHGWFTAPPERCGPSHGSWALDWRNRLVLASDQTRPPRA